jgi:hypothetical protein
MTINSNTKSRFAHVYPIAGRACTYWLVGVLAINATLASAAPVARCPFDNEFTSLSRDGLLYIRHALGLTGAPLVSGTSFSSVQSNAATASLSCATCWPQLDVNGNNGFDVSDALIISRFLAGMRGMALTDGVALGGGARNTNALVTSFIENGCPVTTPSVILAVGDIAYCPGPAATSNAVATAAATRRVPGVPVLTLGDNVYSSGTPTEFSTCFDPTWGSEMPRLRPSPGNHDYNTAGATGYYDYFGRLAGVSNRGYHSYDIGDWHIVALNSNVDATTGSTQELWLRADLANTTRRCKLAYWHHPRFTSSPRGDNPVMADIWMTLYDFKTDVVLNGHEHNYERFAKQTPSAVLAFDGIRQFIVGTGGVGLTPFNTPKPNSELREALTYGALKLTLRAAAYDWEFIPSIEGVIVDSGSASCNN